jgi:hypothetical protein
MLGPYNRFLYALRALESKRQSPKILQIFLDYLEVQGLTIEEKADNFYAMKAEDENPQDITCLLQSYSNHHHFTL